LALLPWWGGFLAGPLVGIAVYITSGDDPLTRAHGRAAALVWGAALAFWAPFTAWIIGFDGPDPMALLVALPFVLLWSIGFCIAETIQERRGLTLFGQQPE
jgi:hypothetical protein